MIESLFPLPDVGEGLTEAEIVHWRVKPGDHLELDEVFVEIETAKSLVELPSAHACTVADLLVPEGHTVAVGTPIIRVLLDAPAEVDADTDTDTTSEPMLVGHGPSDTVRSRRRRHPLPVGPHGERAVAGPARTDPVPVAEHPAEPVLDGPLVVPVIAKPPIRKLAKDLGVDLSRVTPTGPIGDITRDDVIRDASQAGVFRNIQTPELPVGRETRIPVKGVRKAIASAMVRSAFQAPHVSVFTDVDATRTMEYVKRLKASPDFVGVKVSPLLVMARAIIWAVRRNPTANAQWTDDEIIVKHFVNLGVAAATPRGLIVPNVKEAQAMSLAELATALEQLTLTAREGKTQPSEMQGGTITVTNIGVFGMDTGTPILNPGEVSIVALGTIRQKPWVVDGEVRPRFVTTIGGSFDHRVVDGDVASRFLADIAAIMEEPALLLE